MDIGVLGYWLDVTQYPNIQLFPESKWSIRMFGRTPIFVQFNRFGQRFGGSAGGAAGWLLMGPGLALAAFGLAILVWPELLAYLVAGLLLFAGLTLAAWGWQIGQAQKRMQNQVHKGYNEVYYEETRF